jgi:hypothetical protein
MPCWNGFSRGISIRLLSWPNLKLQFKFGHGFNKHMRAFAAAWPEREIVQRVVAQLPWRQNIALLERLDDEKMRLVLRGGP